MFAGALQSQQDRRFEVELTNHWRMWAQGKSNDFLWGFLSGSSRIMRILFMPYRIQAEAVRSELQARGVY